MPLMYRDGEIVEVSEEELDRASLNAPVRENITVSDRQFFHGLAKRALTSQAEALEAVRTGTIPTALRTIIDDDAFQAMLPAGIEPFDVEMFISGAVNFELLHPVSQLISGFLGWTEAEHDEFFGFCSGL